MKLGEAVELTAAYISTTHGIRDIDKAHAI
jgi:hypothetical protein